MRVNPLIYVACGLALFGISCQLLQAIIVWYKTGDYGLTLMTVAFCILIIPIAFKMRKDLLAHIERMKKLEDK